MVVYMVEESFGQKERERELLSKSILSSMCRSILYQLLKRIRKIILLNCHCEQLMMARIKDGKD